MKVGWDYQLAQRVANSLSGTRATMRQDQLEQSIWIGAMFADGEADSTEACLWLYALIGHAVLCCGTDGEAIRSLVNILRDAAWK